MVVVLCVWRGEGLAAAARRRTQAHARTHAHTRAASALALCPRTLTPPSWMAHSRRASAAAAAAAASARLWTEPLRVPPQRPHSRPPSRVLPPHPPPTDTPLSRAAGQQRRGDRHGAAPGPGGGRVCGAVLWRGRCGGCRGGWRVCVEKGVFRVGLSWVDTHPRSSPTRPPTHPLHPTPPPPHPTPPPTTLPLGGQAPRECRQADRGHHPLLWRALPLICPLCRHPRGGGAADV